MPDETERAHEKYSNLLKYAHILYQHDLDHSLLLPLVLSHTLTRSQIKGLLMTKEEFSFNFILNGIDVSPSRAVDGTPHAKCFSFIIFE